MMMFAIRHLFLISHVLFFLLNLNISIIYIFVDNLLCIAVNQIVQANDLHGREALEFLPVDVQISDALHLLFLFRLRHNLFNCLVKNVVSVAVNHITLALVVSVLRKDVLIARFAQWALSFAIFVQFKEV